MKTVRAVALIGLVGLLSFSSGCEVFSGTRAGQAPPGTAFNNGRLDATIDTSVTKATEAARLALVDMKFSVIAYRNEPAAGMVTGLAPNNQHVRIDVRPKDAGHCLLSIDVGDMGNEPQLKEVYSYIKKRL